VSIYIVVCVCVYVQSALSQYGGDILECICIYMNIFVYMYTYVCIVYMYIFVCLCVCTYNACSGHGGDKCLYSYISVCVRVFCVSIYVFSVCLRVCGYDA